MAKAEQECGARQEQREVHSERLLKGARQLIIVHHGVRYTLRVTAGDKLLLTK